MAKQIFRESAMKRLSSPEQLDVLLHVTNPLGWLALVGVGAFLAVVGAWSVFGSIPTKISAKGILLLRKEGIEEVVAEGTGQVAQILVQTGDAVEKGQVVSRISQPQLIEELEQAKRQVRDLKSEASLARQLHSLSRELDEEAQKVEKKGLEQTIEMSKNRRTELDRRLANQRKLLERGLISQQTVFSTQQLIDEENRTTSTSRSKIKQMPFQLRRLENSLVIERERTQRQIVQAEAKVAQLQAQLDQTSEVVTKVAGRVLSLNVALFANVTPGTALMQLGPPTLPTRHLQAVVYAPSTQGKKVRSGMIARVAPGTIKPERYGYIRGKVSFIAEYPTAQATMLAKLGDHDLVESLLKQSPVPLEIHITLELDPNTPSGYAWTSGVGPPMHVTEGTVSTVRITVEDRAPITYIIPLLREWSGTY